jgi:hypothetical protein
MDHRFNRKFGIARCYPSPSTDADAARCANPINAMCRHSIFELAAATGYDVLATKLFEKLGRRPRRESARKARYARCPMRDAPNAAMRCGSRS